MTEPADTVEAARACSTCGEPATNGVVSGAAPVWYCWLHDDYGDVPPIRAAWRRYNHAREMHDDALDSHDTSHATYAELVAAKDNVEAAIRADERSAMTRKALQMGMHTPADCPTAQSTAALRAAARGLLESITRHGEHTVACQMGDEGTPCSCGFAFINEAYDAVKAALDGAPREPSVEEVERVREALVIATGGQPAYLDWSALAVVVLKAAWR